MIAVHLFPFVIRPNRYSQTEIKYQIMRSYDVNVIYCTSCINNFVISISVECRFHVVDSFYADVYSANKTV